MGGRNEDVGSAVAVRESTSKLRVTLDEGMTLAMDELEVVELSYWDDEAHQEKTLRFTRILPAVSGEASLIKLGEVLKARVIEAMFPTGLPAPAMSKAA